MYLIRHTANNFINLERASQMIESSSHSLVTYSRYCLKELSLMFNLPSLKGSRGLEYMYIYRQLREERGIAWISLRGSEALLYNASEYDLST